MSSNRLVVLGVHCRKIQHLLQLKSGFPSSAARPRWPLDPLNVPASASWPWTTRCQQHSLHTTSMRQQQKGKEPLEDEDGPVKYSTSGAHDYESMKTFLTEKSGKPWYQPLCVRISLAVFMIYFFILREENDLDEELGRSIFERIPGLEEQHLLGRIHYFKMQGVDTTELQQRLEEVKLARKTQGEENPN